VNVFSACVKAGLMTPVFLSTALAVAEPALPAAPDPLSSVGKVVIFLLLIVGLILLLAWLVNKDSGWAVVTQNLKWLPFCRWE